MIASQMGDTRYRGQIIWMLLTCRPDLLPIDLKRLAILWTAKIGKTPAGVLWHDGHVLVADMGTDYVAVVDPAVGQVAWRPEGGLPRFLAAGSGRSPWAPL